MMRPCFLLALATACGTTVTRERSESTARVATAEATRSSATAQSASAKRTHRVRTRTTKPSGEVFDVTVTDVSSGATFASASSANSEASASGESSGKSDVTTKTRGWKWVAALVGSMSAIALGLFLLGRRLLRLYL